jgi:hypothetical protein
MEMTEVAERLLSDGRVADREVDSIETMLKTAYSSPAAWGFAALVPVAAVAVLVDYARGRRQEPFDGLPAHLKTDANRFMRLSTVSVLANSPLAALIFVVEMLVAILLFLPLGAVLCELMQVVQLGSNLRTHHRHA